MSCIEAFLSTLSKDSLASSFEDLGLSTVADIAECEASDLVSDLNISTEDADSIVKAAKDAVLFVKRKDLIQTTWATVESALDVEATKLFYNHMFETHPEAKPLFASTDMDEQSEKLYKSLQTAVKYLDDVPGLIPVLQEMGKLHALDYKARRPHYDIVGEALLWTLKTGLGDAWTDDVAEAWTWVYGVISTTMADAGDAALEETGEEKKEDMLTDEEKAAKDAALFAKRKDLIQTTWATVEGALDVEATKLFYNHMFETHPEAKPLFASTDMEEQSEKLYKSLQTAVKYLDDVPGLIPVLQEMGKLHALDYKARRPHYDIVGEALLWTLKTGLGDDWTDDVAEAWVWVYGVISTTMADAGDAALEETGESKS